MVRATRFDGVRITLLGLLSSAASFGLVHRDAGAAADSAAIDVAAAAPISATTSDASKPDDDIVVTARRRGEARTPPETEFSEDEIATFGADSVQELLGRLEPFINAGDDAPALLINGKPAGFDQSVLSYPPEALERLAVLPPEAAARYGQPSGKRVVNLVLKQKFASTNLDAALTWATRGGQHGGQLSAGQVTINGDTRWNAQAFVTRDSALRKSARNIPPRPGAADRVGYVASAGGTEIDPALSLGAGGLVTVAAIPREAVAGAPTLADFVATANSTHPLDPNDYETLQPSRRSLSFRAGAGRPVGEFSASLNINASRNTSRGQRGLPMASVLVPASSSWSPFASDVILTRPFDGERVLRNDNTSKQLGISLTLTGAIAGWQTSFSTNYGRNWSNSLLEHAVDVSSVQASITAGDPAFNPYGPWEEHLLASSRYRSRGDRLDASLNVMKSILSLPAGPASTTLALNASRYRTRSWQADTLIDLISQEKTTREQMDGQITFSLPLSRRVDGEKSSIGDLTLDLTMSGQAMSGTPLQKRYGSTVIWSPFPALQLRGAFDHVETAPMLEQLNGPIISTISRVYDYSRQEMAEPVWTIGGNPDLQRGQRQSLAVSAQVRPLSSQALTLNVAYRRTVAKGGVAGFPVLTPAIEAAFPERVTRDAEGRLIAVDARPINIAHDTNAELASSIVLRWQSGQNAKMDGAQARPADPLMVTASLNHQWRLENELLIRPGIAPIDQLGEDGGQPRHMLSLQVTAGKRGMGASWSANWTGDARLRGTTPSQDFHFKPFMTHNLALHIEPYEVFSSLNDAGWAKNLRISFDVQNLFDGYRRVTFADGSTPGGFSRDEIDPLGRTVRLSAQKRF